MLEQSPPFPLRKPIARVTSSVVGDPSEVWQLTSFWRVPRTGDPIVTGRAVRMAIAIALEKCI